MNRYLPALVFAAVIVGIFLMFDWRMATAVTALLMLSGIIYLVTTGGGIV